MCLKVTKLVKKVGAEEAAATAEVRRGHYRAQVNVERLPTCFYLRATGSKNGQKKK